MHLRCGHGWQFVGEQLALADYLTTPVPWWSAAPHVNAVGLEWGALWALDVRRDPLRAPIGMIGPTRLLTPMTAHPPSVSVLTVTR